MLNSKIKNKRLLYCVLAAFAGSAVVHFVIADQPCFVSYYAKFLRGSLFSGFLSVAGFLLSLKVFIVFKIKENVYDSEEYERKFQKIKKIEPNLEYYAPLRRLSDFLFYSICTAVVASLSQITVGLVPANFAVEFSLFLAFLSVSVFIATLFIVKKVLNSYFSHIEEK